MKQNSTGNLSLADRAYRQVEEMIVTLTLPPGTVFSEAELSKQIGIGRTPLREALQRLAADRLVVTLPRRGMMVTAINIADQLMLLETRRELDRLIATRAARRSNPLQREQLRDCAKILQTAAAEGDIEEFMRTDRACDQIVEAACRNPFAVQANAPLHAHCRRFWYYYQSSGDLKHAAELHTALMEAIAGGQEARAATASDQLLDYLEEFTKSALELL